MQPKPRSPEETYAPALEKAQQAFPELNPLETATRAGVRYEEGVFHVPFFGSGYEVEWPDSRIRRAFDHEEVDIATRILILHYLLTADGTPLADKWIAFRSLPGGLGYDAAFRGRAGLRLERAFGSNGAAFEAAAQSLGGERLAFGDASFSFQVLPRVWLAAVLYLADDEFSANVNVLFDGSASHYLATEDLAVLGGMLAGRLVKAARGR